MDSPNTSARDVPNGKAWLTQAAVIAALSLVVSLSAFVVSARSCSIARQTLVLRQQEFDAVRQIVLSGSVLSNGKSLKLAPTNRDITVQKIEVEFPWIAVNGGISLRDSLELEAFPVGMRLKDELSDVIANAQAPCSIRGELPIILKSYYTYAGEQKIDESLYKLSFGLYYRGDRTLELTEFRGMAFEQRLEPERLEQPRQPLSSMWEKTSLRCDL
jgi:hypothetical protein